MRVNHWYFRLLFLFFSAIPIIITSLLFFALEESMQASEKFYLFFVLRFLLTVLGRSSFVLIFLIDCYLRGYCVFTFSLWLVLCVRFLLFLHS